MAREPGRVTLGTRLRSARATAFVGRTEELARFRAAIARPEPAILWIFAPGGTGKSALLHELAAIARAQGTSCIEIDLAAIEASPAAITGALAAGSDGSRPVVLLDSYEHGIAIDAWLRGRLLPTLPADVVLVIAGRNPPALEWRTDRGVQSLLHVVPLGQLDASASRALLAGRGITEEHSHELLSLAHGHALTLVLLGEVLGGREDRRSPASLRDVPEVLAELVARLVREISADEQRRALELCAHARQTNEDLLRGIVDPVRAHELLGWLRALPYASIHADGVALHPIVRDAIDADFRWRDPPGYRALHRAIGRHLLERIQAAPELERDRAFLDLLYLRRVSPIARRIFDFDTLGSGWAEVPRADERELVVALVQAHEGPASAAIARAWFDRRRESFTVLRGSGGEPVAVSLHVVLSAIPSDVIAIDPALTAIGRFAEARGALREGRRIVVTRFSVGRDPSSDGRLRHYRPMLLWLTAPSLAFAVTALADGERWADALVEAGHRREGEFVVDGRVAPLFVADFHARPASEWLLDLLLRDLDAAPAQPEPPTAQQVGLDREALGAALREALEHFTRIDRLRDNALLDSRWLKSRAADAAPSPELLRRLLRELVAAMHDDPRDGKLARALEAAFVHPAGSREAAAERIDVPFSTFRRHVAKGIERLEEMLWSHERPR